jgi:hypothetical protein
MFLAYQTANIIHFTRVIKFCFHFSHILIGSILNPVSVVRVACLIFSYFFLIFD